MSLLRTILRFALAVTFLLSASGKLISLPEFVQVIHTYVSLPIVLLYSIAALICISELTLGLMMLLGKKTALASFGIMLMTLAFTVVKIIILLDGTSRQCFCFGALAHEIIGWETLTRNGCILITSWVLVQVNLRNEFHKRSSNPDNELFNKAS